MESQYREGQYISLIALCADASNLARQYFEAAAARLRREIESKETELAGLKAVNEDKEIKALAYVERLLKQQGVARQNNFGCLTVVCILGGAALLIGGVWAVGAGESAVGGLLAIICGMIVAIPGIGLVLRQKRIKEQLASAQREMDELGEKRGVSAARGELMQTVKMLDLKWRECLESAQRMRSPAKLKIPGHNAVPVRAETFSVRLISSGKNQIGVLKLLREVTGLGLEAAKQILEHTPAVVVTDLSKEQADQIKEKLRSCGSNVEVLPQRTST